MGCGDEGAWAGGKKGAQRGVPLAGTLVRAEVMQSRGAGLRSQGLRAPRPCTGGTLLSSLPPASCKPNPQSLLPREASGFTSRLVGLPDFPLPFAKRAHFHHFHLKNTVSQQPGCESAHAASGVFYFNPPSVPPDASPPLASELLSPSSCTYVEGESIALLTLESLGTRKTVLARQSPTDHSRSFLPPSPLLPQPPACLGPKAS